MRAAYYEIVIEQGAVYQSPTFLWTNKAGAAIDLTNIDFEIDVRPTKDSSTVLITGSYVGLTNTPSGDIIITEGGAAGTLSFRILRAVTAALTFTQAVYDLHVIETVDTHRLIEGPVILSKGVTR